MILTLFGHQRDVWGLQLEGYDRHKKTVWKVFGWVFGAAVVLSVITAATTAAFDSTGPTTFGWILIAVVGVSVLAAAAILFLGYRGTRPDSANVVNHASPFPPAIHAHVEELVALRERYFQAAVINRSAGAIVEQIDLLVINVTELFQRLAAKGDKSQRRRALTEYDENLGRLATALGPDYGLDLIANPRLWDEPEQRLANVQVALRAVDSQLVDNIKQVNARQRLIFDAGVDRLMDPRTLGG